MDLQKGLICSVTNEKADFEGSCNDFERDETVEDEVQPAESLNHESAPEIPEELLSKLRSHQDISYAFIGGFFLSVICAIIWAVITVTTEYQIGYMAIGLGFVVGMGVRFFGAGIDPIYGFVGAFLALVGCLLGNLFSQVGFIANEQSWGYFETLSFLDLPTIILLYQETFSVIDLLFYAIAVYIGYKFAFRQVPAHAIQTGQLAPANARLRLPLVIVFIVVLSGTGFALSKGVTGEQVFHYESGEVQARGQLVDGLEDGEWSFFHENGELQAVATFAAGVENGPWEWYYESGTVMRQGTYKNGLYDGSWLSFNELGILIDSSNYINGRLDGETRSYYENGNLMQTGQYKRDRQVGVWNTYFENGVLSAQGSFVDGEFSGLWKLMNEDGSPRHEMDYIDPNTIRILNAWDLSGKQIVKDGNGTYTSYYENTQKMDEGQVKDGKKVGTWTTYFQDGTKKEVGEYRDEKLYLISAWSASGEELVTDGSGMYTTYWVDGINKAEEGFFVAGLRHGKWVSYHPGTDVVQQEANYERGKLTGPNVSYYASGAVFAEGQLDADSKEGEWVWYYESGSLQCTVSFINDLKEGDQIFWSESGREAKKEVYKGGELIEEVLL